jgi:hypothetical protein
VSKITADLPDDPADRIDEVVRRLGEIQFGDKALWRAILRANLAAAVGVSADTIRYYERRVYCWPRLGLRRVTGPTRRPRLADCVRSPRAKASVPKADPPCGTSQCRCPATGHISDRAALRGAVQIDRRGLKSGAN